LKTRLVQEQLRRTRHGRRGGDDVIGKKPVDAFGSLAARCEGALKEE
jgi:hypothetical protein